MLRYLVLALLLIGAVSCNEAPPESGDAPVARPFRTTGTEPAPQEAQTEDIPSLEGTEVTAASGAAVEVISVGTFDENTVDLAGLIAVEGRVNESFPERGAFLLVDYDRMKGCSTDCCPQAEVPVRLTMEEFEGELPVVDDVVVLIGELTVTDTGYVLTVAEVQRAGKAILSKTV